MKDDRQTEKRQQSESLSFQSITAEIGDISIPVSEERAAETPVDPIHLDGMSGTVIVEELEAPPPEEDINLRVLTGSSPKPRPMWAEGMFSAILAGLFIAPVVLRMGLLHYQPWISYMVILLALGASLWSLLGLRQATTVIDKRMCYITAVINLIILLTAFLMRRPPGA